jgi:hypothetical protein
MDRVASSGNGTRSRGRPSAEPSSAALFGLLWEALAGLLGTAAAAMLLRRAAQRAKARHPDLTEVVIGRAGLEYVYTLPSAWNDAILDGHRALRHLVDELLPLLAELTGAVVIRHLAEVPELRERGIIPPQEEGP